MKICLLGEFSGDLDEGMRKSSHYYREKLREGGNEVLAVDLFGIRKSGFIRDIRKFDPDIVHITHGPTLKGLALLKVISVCRHGTRTVASAMMPDLSPALRTLMPLLKPDLVLTQSVASDRKFRAMGCDTRFLPAGVDTEKFSPATGQARRELRRKYGINEDKFVVLHVGSIKEKRNVRSLAGLYNSGTEVVIVGAVSPGHNEALIGELQDAGCTVQTEYFGNVEELYQLSDCYVFPATGYDPESGKPVFCSIEIPLSVMEAMSCNLPVVTTRFGGLTRLFKEGNGLIFVNNDSELRAKVGQLMSSKASVDTRGKVIRYSWDNIAMQLATIYEDVRGRKAGAGQAGGTQDRNDAI